MGVYFSHVTLTDPLGFSIHQGLNIVSVGRTRNFSTVYTTYDSKFHPFPWLCGLISGLPPQFRDYVHCLKIESSKGQEHHVFLELCWFQFRASSLPFSLASRLSTASMSSSLDKDLDEDLSLVDSSSILNPSLLSTKLR